VWCLESKELQPVLRHVIQNFQLSYLLGPCFTVQTNKCNLYQSLTTCCFHQFHYPILFLSMVCGLVWLYSCVGSMATSRLAADNLHSTNRCIHVTWLGGGRGGRIFKIFDYLFAWFKASIVLDIIRVSCFGLLQVCYKRLYCNLMPSDVTVNVDLPTVKGCLQRISVLQYLSSSCKQ
jgi:hypothetical protein